MKQVKIVTDSTSDLTTEELSKYAITVVPLTVSINGENYTDGENLTKEEFVLKMQQSEELPKTAQPSIGRFKEVFDELTADGSEVLAILASEKLSGTVNASRQAAELAEGKVTVVDSGVTTRGLAYQVIAAHLLAQEGKSLEEIIEKIIDIKRRTKIYLDVVHLDNLTKGGRMSRAKGLLSNLLNIKVFLEFNETEGNTLIAKGRGMKAIKREFERLKDEYLKIKDDVLVIDFCYVNMTDFNRSIIQMFRDEFPEAQSIVTHTSPVVAAHAGLEAMGIILVTK
ncbi:DegV family protein [Atopobacter phocae]|uniref:DegV family protein n=1 Tax=Atopobacter phocae TaxID=136492 RepID=UPI0004712C4C|nr:DegV family protein [Atopobacter phocae]